MPLLNILLDKSPWPERFSRLQVPIRTAEQLLTSDSIFLAKALALSVSEIEDVKKVVARSIFFDRVTEGGNDFSWSDFHSLSDFSGAADTNSPCATSYHDVNDSLQTGFPDLDRLFDGGLPRNSTISILGDSSCGKTQLVLSIAITNAMKGVRVLVIDTCNGVSIKRVRSMAQSGIEKQLAAMDQVSMDATTPITTDPTAKQNLKARLQAAQAQTLSRICIQKVFDLLQAIDMLCRVKEAVPAFDLVIIDCFHQLITPYLSDSKVGDRSVSAGGRGLSVGSGTGNPPPIFSAPLILQFNTLLRSLCSDGRTTVVVTNTLQTSKPTGSTYRSSTRQLSSASGGIGGIGGEICTNSALPQYPTGTGGIANHVEAFDTVLLLNRGGQEVGSTDTSPVDQRLDTVFSAHIILRPPYYNHHPSRCILRFPNIPS